MNKTGIFILTFVTYLTLILLPSSFGDSVQTNLQQETITNQKSEFCTFEEFFSLIQNCETSSKTDAWISIFTGTVVIILFTVVIRYYDGKSEKEFRPLFFESSNKVFELLSGSENKIIWRRLPILYKFYTSGNMKGLDIFHGINHDEIYRLKENLNKLGSLYLSNVIDKKFLFNTYGDKIIEFYWYLEEDIKNIREIVTKNPEHCKLFQYLYYAAVNYVKTYDYVKYERLRDKFKNEYKKEFHTEIPKNILNEIPNEYRKMLLLPTKIHQFKRKIREKR